MKRRERIQEEGEGGKKSRERIQEEGKGDMNKEQGKNTRRSREG